jgi:hypothetical protein
MDRQVASLFVNHRFFTAYKICVQLNQESGAENNHKKSESG